MRSTKKSVNIVVDDTVIEEAIDKYLQTIFGKGVYWVEYEHQSLKPKVIVEGYVDDSPFNIDGQYEDEWD
jgi:hypothetical protein